MDMEVILGEGTKVKASFKGFEIRTDQPASAGGDNSAPSPMDLFLASMGTCMGYFVLAFCRERKLDTSGISIQVSFDRPGKLVEVVRTIIRLPVDFPEKYKNAVIACAESCTVKKHLAQPPKFQIETATA